MSGMFTISLGFKIDTGHTIVVPVGDRGVGMPTVIDPRGLAEILVKAIAPVLSSLESWGHKREDYRIMLPYPLFQATHLYVVSEWPHLTILEAVWQMLGKFDVEAVYPPADRAQVEMDASIGFMGDQMAKWKARAEAAEQKVESLKASLKMAMKERRGSTSARLRSR